MRQELENQPAKEAAIRGRCQECRFSALAAQPPFQPSLMCRRNPPVPLLMPGQHPGQIGCIGLYPNVDPNGTCGEFQPEGPRLQS